MAAQTWTLARAKVSVLIAGGWRSPRTLAFVAAFLIALLVAVALGAAGLDLLAGGPHGHEGIAGHR